MRKIIFPATIIAALSASALATGAQAQMTASSARSACMWEYLRFCSGVMPGGGRIIACLSKHTEALNAECAAAVSLGARCVDDYRKFCASAAPGSGALRACLFEHRARLTAGCAAIVAKSAGN
jgi:hypothetical protein